MDIAAQELHAVEAVETELVDDSATFFAPVSSDLIDSLIGRYQNMLSRVEEMGKMIGSDPQAVAVFIDGNCEPGRWSAPSVDKMFDIAGAIGSLNSQFWAEAMSLTDVYDCMPQKRRDEWSTSIRDKTTPDFVEDTVRSTFLDFFASRDLFLAERVDGIFRGLSGEHVTNAPEAFGKRMIIAGALSEYHTAGTNACGLINDLRCVIAKFMGRDEPKWFISSKLVTDLRNNWGEWTTIDGGALRIRLYKKGTAHLEVHPDMAWRLNCVLAKLYPLAIPAEFRQRPKKKAKEFVMMGRPLPFAVLELLAGMEVVRERVGNSWPEIYRPVPNALSMRGVHGGSKVAQAEAERVLQSIGGVPVLHYWQFDYDAAPVLREIVTSGCIPDHRAHQFYPTPERLAKLAIETAEIGEADTVLEPSAGQGGIADHLPKGRTTCVEISPLLCKILAAKGHTVVEADFVHWADFAFPHQPTYDRVVMNPPYSEGRWKLHIEMAASCVKAGGRLVAILPASARGKQLLAGFDCTWSTVFENEFAGTSTAVVIMTARRTA